MFKNSGAEVKAAVGVLWVTWQETEPQAAAVGGQWGLSAKTPPLGRVFHRACLSPFQLPPSLTRRCP